MQYYTLPFYCVSNKCIKSTSTLHGNEMDKTKIEMALLIYTFIFIYASGLSFTLLLVFFCFSYSIQHIFLITNIWNMHCVSDVYSPTTSIPHIHTIYVPHISSFHRFSHKCVILMKFTLFSVNKQQPASSNDNYHNTSHIVCLVAFVDATTIRGHVFYPLPLKGHHIILNYIGPRLYFAWCCCYRRCMFF